MCIQCICLFVGMCMSVCVCCLFKNFTWYHKKNNDTRTQLFAYILKWVVSQKDPLFWTEGVFAKKVFATVHLIFDIRSESNHQTNLPHFLPLSSSFFHNHHSFSLQARIVTYTYAMVKYWMNYSKTCLVWKKDIFLRRRLFCFLSAFVSFSLFAWIVCYFEQHSYTTNRLCVFFSTGVIVKGCPIKSVSWNS